MLAMHFLAFLVAVFISTVAFGACMKPVVEAKGTEKDPPSNTLPLQGRALEGHPFSKLFRLDDTTDNSTLSEMMAQRKPSKPDSKSTDASSVDAGSFDSNDSMEPLGLYLDKLTIMSCPQDQIKPEGSRAGDVPRKKSAFYYQSSKLPEIANTAATKATINEEEFKDETEKQPENMSIQRSASASFVFEGDLILLHAPPKRDSKGSILDCDQLKKSPSSGYSGSPPSSIFGNSPGTPQRKVLLRSPTSFIYDDDLNVKYTHHSTINDFKMRKLSDSSNDDKH